MEAPIFSKVANNLLRKLQNVNAKAPEAENNQFFRESQSKMAQDVVKLMKSITSTMILMALDMRLEFFQKNTVVTMQLAGNNN